MKRMVLILLLACAVCAGVFAQQKPVSLEQAINEAVQQLFNQLPEGSRVAVYDFTTPGNARIENGKNELSEYIVEKVTALFTGNPHFTLTDRQNIEALKKETEYQYSGEVDDETIQAIGKRIGAQYLLTGSIRIVDQRYELSMKVMHIETGVGAATALAVIRGSDSQLNSFLVQEQKHFRISLGARAGGSLNFWTLSNDIIGNADSPSFGFEPAIQTAFHFIDFLAVQTEAALSMDKVSYSGTEPENGDYTAFFQSYSLRVPVLVRFTYHNPDKLGKFSIGAFAGVGFNIPLGAMQLQSNLYGDSSYRFSLPPSYVIGINPGLRLGSGLLFADIRFSGDFNKTAIHDSSGTLALYNRNTLSFSLGYEYDFDIKR